MRLSIDTDKKYIVWGKIVSLCISLRKGTNNYLIYIKDSLNLVLMNKYQLVMQ
jgi:hypothetical protein